MGSLWYSHIMDNEGKSLEERYPDVDFDPDYKKKYSIRYKSLRAKITELENLLKQYEHTPFSGPNRKKFYNLLNEIEELADQFDRDSFNLWSEIDVVE